MVLFNHDFLDHVGIVLRNVKNEIYIYESTSTEGVGLTPWRHMIKYDWYQGCDKITWRRLNTQLEVKDIDTMENFIVKTLGKGF